MLRQAPPGLRYLGLMGSKRKIERVRAEVAARGQDPGAVELHAPIGLPLGGDSPGEIAIGILAEVIASRHGGGTSRQAERRPAVAVEVHA